MPRVYLYQCRSLEVILNSSLVILTIYLDSVFCLRQHSFTSTVMFKLLHYKSKTIDMVIECIREQARHELALLTAVCLHNCTELRLYYIITVFPPFN